MKVQDIFGGVFKSTELSATLTEIVKIDPTFEREKFLKECESDIIPNVLEAITRGDLEILEDWWVDKTFFHYYIEPTGAMRLPSTFWLLRSDRPRPWGW